jgi:hypothetical protein
MSDTNSVIDRTSRPAWIFALALSLLLADGALAEDRIVGGKNILDWTTPPDQAGEVKYDPALGLILPATSVASPQFVHVTVWMLLWKNPHPDKPIAALEVKGRNEGIPGLLGVSLGRSK